MSSSFRRSSTPRPDIFFSVAAQSIGNIRAVSVLRESTIDRRREGRGTPSSTNHTDENDRNRNILSVCCRQPPSKQSEMTCMRETTPIIVCSIAVLGVLDSFLSIFACSFFTLELEYDEAGSSGAVDNSDVMSMGLFRFHLGEGSVSFQDSGSCQTYDPSFQEAPSFAAQAFAVLAPLVGLLGCIFGGLGFSCWRQRRTNRIAGALCALAAVFQGLTFLTIIQEGRCDDGECSLDIGGELSIVAVMLYLIGAIGFVTLPTPDPLGWSIREALTYKKDQDPGQNQAKSAEHVEDWGTIVHLQDEYQNAKDEDAIPATLEEARNSSRRDDDTEESHSSNSVSSPATNSCDSPHSIHDTLPRLLSIEKVQSSPEGTITTMAASFFDPSPDESLSSGSDHCLHEVETNDECPPAGRPNRKQSFRCDFTGQCVAETIDSFEEGSFGEDNDFIFRLEGAAQ